MNARYKELCETFFDSYSVSGLIGAVIGAASIFHLAADLFHFGLSSTIRFMLKAYTDILRDTVVAALLFWVPFHVPSFIKDFLVLYMVGAGILLRAVRALESKMKEKSQQLIQPETVYHRVRRILYMLIFSCLWPVKAKQNWEVRVHSVDQLIQLEPEIERSPLQPGMARLGPAGTLFRNFIVTQAAIIGFALTIIILSNGGVGLPSEAFRHGAADRDAWEEWFAGLSGDYRDGAKFWATVRSRSGSGSCFSGRGGISSEYRSGRLAAQKFLVGVDAGRQISEYWCGWNQLQSGCRK